ncbi:MAG: transcriptional repressor NrdR [Candidatus Sericytochromatia bacterium]|nr:transcriptional repressor NrdR [Candidatus Sericytochromatia bacterium]
MLESRILEGESALRRRRECQECRRRFTTYERLAMNPVLVTKRDTSRELFDRRKLLEGINRACIHTRVGVADMEQVVDAIEQRVASRTRPEATSAEIGEMVLEELLPLDEVAYVRFASVYRHFAGVEDFIRELQRVERLNGAVVAGPSRRPGPPRL